MGQTNYGLCLLGDDAGNVYFRDAGSGSQLYPPAGPYFTSISAPPLTYNQWAIAPFTGGGAGELHAFDLTNGQDLWSSGVQFNAGLNATPARMGTMLYVATSDGYLRAINITDIRNPVVAWNLNVLNLPSGTATVNAVLLAPGGNMAVLVTSVGIYGVNITAATGATVAWHAQTNTNFAQVTPLLADGLLFAVSGQKLYAFDVNGTPDADGNVPALWILTGPSGNSLLAPAQTQLGFLLVPDSAANFYLLSPRDGTLNNTFALGNQGTVWWWTLYGSYVAIASNSGPLAVYTLNFQTSGPTLTRTWQLTQNPRCADQPLLSFTQTAQQFSVLLYVPTADGSVYAFDVTNGGAVWHTVVASGGARLSQPSNLLLTSSSAAVGFLMDGQNYFLTQRNLLLAVRNKSFTGVTLPGPDHETFESLVIDTGAAGQNVYVVLWDIGHVKMLAALYEKVNGRFPVNLYENKKTWQALNGKAKVSVCLETYGVVMPKWWDVNLSNHQKISIFSVNGQKIALVAGLNTERSYWDTVTHPDSQPDYASTHDTALLLQGDAVNYVEDEFDRRWQKVNGSLPQPSSNSYAKIAGWIVYRDMCFDAKCELGSTPTPYTSPVLSTSPVAVDVLRTNNEDWAPVTQVREALVEEIGNAKQYAYFENVGFFDVPLVRQLIQTLKTADSSFRLIINVPQPQPLKAEDIFQQAYNSLTRAAVAAILLSLNNWTSFTDPEGDVVERADLLNFGVVLFEESVWGKYSILESYVVYQFYLGGPINKLPLTKIQNVVTTERRVLLCGPARYFPTIDPSNTAVLANWPHNYRRIYIHSKLALFDDQVALIGSANFTQRSLYLDGEMSVRVKDLNTVQGIRQQLFSHWQMNSAASWAQDMQTFANLPVGSLSRIGILPTTVNNLWIAPSDVSWKSWFIMNYFTA